jgi:hypothetical protein
LKDRIVQIVSQPLFISIIIGLIIIAVLPEYHNKYEVELIEAVLNDRENQTFFHDLNNDFVSERIMYYQNVLGNAAYEIHTSEGGLVDQWNLSSEHSSQRWILNFFDLNDNGFSEIYHLTKQNDSILLNIEEHFSPKPFIDRGIFIDTLTNIAENMFFSNNVFGAIDTDGDGIKEVFLYLNRGFTGNPRNIYKYDLATKKVLKSVHLTNQSRIDHIIDLDGDGKKEIILSNYAAGNEIDSTITKRSDYHAWFTVLNNDLSFRFDPIEIKSDFASTHSLPFFNKDGKFDVLTRINSKEPDKYPNKLILFSNEGEVLREQNLENGTIFLHPQKEFETFMIYNKKNGEVEIFNNEFDRLVETRLDANSYILPLDIDENGSNEWIVIHADKKTVSVFEEDFEDSLSFTFPGNGFTNLKPFLQSTGEGKNNLFFRDGNHYYLYSYSKNQWYFLKYAMYLLIFISVFGLVWLIRKGQELKTKKQRAIEQEIAQLQIKNINNQINPHFVFNAINTISDMTLMEDKFEADNFISRYSKFMRGTLQHSDQITTTLEEELDYVENYIQLQQVRFANKFEYKIEIDTQVDLFNQVPKHILFGYVENAIKHGLSQNDKKGKLKIQVNQNLKYLTMTIEDNGLGIQSGKTYRKDSTGSGIRIMEQVFELFYKLYKKQIEHSIIELFDEQKKPSGIRIELRISV